MSPSLPSKIAAVSFPIATFRMLHDSAQCSSLVWRTIGGNLRIKKALVLTIFLVVPGGLFAGHAHASLSRAMQFKCNTVPEYHEGDLRRDDDWVQSQLKGFLPEPGAPSLRLTSLTELVPQVELALQGIRSTCHDFRVGKMPEYDADSQLASFEQTIHEFEEALASEAGIQASSGDVTKIGNIRGVLTDIAAAGRQNALMGEDLLADAAMHVMVKTVETFDAAFAVTCYNQSFDRDIALALERQRSLLGLETNVLPCAFRLYEAKWAPGTDAITWKHCGIGVGIWKVKISGLLIGEGEGVLEPSSKGEYSAHFSKMGLWRADLTEKGTLDVHCTRSSACDCLQHPANDECKGVDTSQAQNELSVRGDSLIGNVYNGPSYGPRAWSNPRSSLLWQDYPVTVNKVDQPCKPDDATSQH
jgi:hypothetical protein